MTDHPPSLFNVDQTTDQECLVCGAVRAAGEEKAGACQYDRDRDGRRPTGCLNAHDPKHSRIPF